MTLAEARATLQAVETHGGVLPASVALGIPRPTFQNRHQRAKFIVMQHEAQAQQPGAAPVAPALPTRDMELESLRRQLREAQAARSLHDWAKQIIHAADEQARDCRPAEWTRSQQHARKPAGIPTLLLSDLHWGEVVRPEEIGGVNAYDMAIAQARLQRVIGKTKSLLRDHVVGDYPGIVVCLGGDMVSGSMHDELEQTNDGTVMQQMLDLFEHLQRALLELADEFGKVHVPAVTGNHGRSNKKWQAKQRAALSYEWLMYQFLQRALAGDDRISFQVPDGPDTSFELQGTKYRLTHGDAFKSSDSVIGPVGPITRGTLKRSRMALAMSQPFDHLLLGHWHQLIWGSNFIVNGSLKGYDEYSMSYSFTPEPPCQALWLTTERHGRTIQLPVYANS